MANTPHTQYLAHLLVVFAIMLMAMPIGMMLRYSIRHHRYNKWAKEHPTQHALRMQQYLKTGRSIYEKPWG